ncbi:hypothetical protein BCR36DRAFT_353919 [Piromyces finnis]|uniref:CAAX prenyl protease 2/Lysostaphin resistance protein A-like domain-containing protein n=1 Tax=Piromyces finnis TaxID=1754191 RepID=A0A1Y1V813_9FUNG|nr:hypothetical protein BCR36DRAFT_353919 [Piromyces finnis]|eukprot:ORX48894.1 hypothetical protein BCR36DRAFT_353919 [Piromyces finnis]
MIEILNLLLIVIPFVLSIPLSLYIGGVFENLKNYKHYIKSKESKKKDDYELKNNDNDQDYSTTNTSSNKLYNNSKEENNNKPNKIKICLKDFISKKLIPEISDVYTLKFWIPSKLSVKNSIVGFIVAIIFGQPWLDNPIIQVNSFNKCLYTPKSNSLYQTNKKILKSQKNLIQDSIKPKNHQTLSVKDKYNIKKTIQCNTDNALNDKLLWNPENHFDNTVKILFINIIRFFCSCFIIPIIEELMFRYIFYRFIIGGFNYKFVSFNTWKWTAAILSNIALTHLFYIRCYGKEKEWITGLINGYLCTYSMVKQGQWNASVNTRSLINFYIGLIVFITKKYKY